MLGTWWTALKTALSEWLTAFGAVPVSGTVSTTGLTDAQLRATPVPVSGTVTATGPLTDAQLRASPVPVTSTAAAEPATYSAAVTFLPGALPTDIFTITGSASKTVKVKMFLLSGTSSGIAKVVVAVNLRSAANTGGTSTAPAAVAHDSNNAVATATVLAYTVPPTVGTLVGAVSTVKLTEPSAGDANLTFPITIAPRPGSQPYTLRGTSQVLALTRDGTTNLGESISCAVEWTEE